MGTKSEETKAYILEKVAPIFNSKGYVGTSLSELTEATGLTKGAIYGNFKNKEDLAVKAFKYNVKRVMIPISIAVNEEEYAIDKLYAITNFYKSYYDYTKEFGGCPILNTGVDTNNINTNLYKAAKDVSTRVVNILSEIVQIGIDNNEIKSNTDPDLVAKNFYCMLEGSIFMAFTHKDQQYITDIANHIDQFVIALIKK